MRHLWLSLGFVLADNKHDTRDKGNMLSNTGRCRVSLVGVWETFLVSQELAFSLRSAAHRFLEPNAPALPDSDVGRWLLPRRNFTPSLHSDDAKTWRESLIKIAGSQSLRTFPRDWNSNYLVLSAAQFRLRNKEEIVVDRVVDTARGGSLLRGTHHGRAILTPQIKLLSFFRTMLWPLDHLSQFPCFFKLDLYCKRL